VRDIELDILFKLKSLHSELEKFSQNMDLLEENYLTKKIICYITEDLEEIINNIYKARRHDTM